VIFSEQLPCHNHDLLDSNYDMATVSRSHRHTHILGLVLILTLIEIFGIPTLVVKTIQKIGVFQFLRLFTDFYCPKLTQFYG